MVVFLVAGSYCLNIAIQLEFHMWVNPLCSGGAVLKRHGKHGRL